MDLPSEDVSVGFWLFAKQYEAVHMPLSLKADGCLSVNHVLDVRRVLEFLMLPILIVKYD